MSAIVEIPSVNSAVQKLQELGDRMRSADFGFHDNDVSNIDSITEALLELEKQRLKIHEELETETIRASIKRHCLQFLPQEVKKEISAAVKSARESNAEALNNLRNQLAQITQNIAYLEKRHKELDEENAILHPERELIREQHEEIISQLNRRMAEKASMQIMLNETRDNVRQTNQDIVDLEDGILQLKEDLILERNEARQEKKKLKKARFDTEEKAKVQNEQNIEKKKELDVLHDRKVDSESKLDILRKSLRRYETSKAKLEGEERNLNAQIQKQLKHNEELRRKGLSIQNEDMKLQLEFEEDERRMKGKIQQLQQEITNETSRKVELEKDKLDLQNELEKRLEIKKADLKRVEQANEELQKEKQQLGLKAEEMGRLRSENTDMQEQIENLAESHKIVLAQLNIQIEDYREQLMKERKERLVTQEQKSSLSKELEDYKTDNQNKLQALNKLVTEGKTEHMELANEGTKLQKELKEDESLIKTLEEELDNAQKNYQTSFTFLQTKVETMEREIIEMEHEIGQKKQEIENKTPGFEELEKRFEARTAAYEKLKKDIVDLKGKKQTLSDIINKTKGEKERTEGPLAKVKVDLKQKREEAIYQLKKHGEETANIEREIFVEGCKLKTVMEENQKLRDACMKTEEDIYDLKKQMENNQQYKVRLLRALEEVKDELTKRWNEDVELQETFSQRDQLVVDGLGELLDTTEKRETKINEITQKLETELQYLGNFLENLASRRPKDSREGKRPVSTNSRLSRLSQREQLDNQTESKGRKSSAGSRSSHPRTASSVRSVTISEKKEILGEN
ncbi:hypothetical protein CHS0354_038952 [Potamilus streckersoni]|uniref:Uncharacterized protein n=1 Tax=Potamilus streckersoni TaxID=2493646 RepID=A0AAE0S1G2_9BIVA|nr:hypothetical protein CHS0354_038952 [Potamilus streckersoni]